MERPSPVPSPGGLVVKNGLNIFSFTSGGMPVPLSRILISMLSPRFLVAAIRVGDFIAVGEHLIAEHYTRRGRIIAMGDSAGGALVGAATNMAPDLFLA